jgi:hypothetical protein
MNEKYHYDELSDTLRVQRVEDVTPVIEANKRAFNEASRTHKDEVFNHKASVPMSAIEQYCQTHGIKWADFWADTNKQKQFLNDPENRFFLTRPGKV